MHELALALAVSGAIVVSAGILLGWAADTIANITGLGGMWTGWIMLAGATSLPELVTDVSAVRLHSARLAGGDLFGSSLTNMAILAIISMIFVAQSDGGSASQGAVSAWLAVMLTVLGALFTRLHTAAGWMRLRPESLLILVIWLAGTRLLYRREKLHAAPFQVSTVTAKPLVRRLYLAIAVFAAGSAMIFFIAPRFADFARQFAVLSGLDDSFVGLWVLGFSTALPELVTSVTACRLGAFDLAVANLYGSCAFNMVVFFAMDLASPLPVFSQLEPVLAISGLLAAALMVLGLRALSFRRHASGLREVGGGILLASYAAAIWTVYALR